jgi:hypothetical protein
MQLSSTLRLALAGAASTLLAGTAAAQAAPAESPATTTASRPPIRIDTGMLIYAESGGRVKAVEPMVAAHYTDGNDRSYSLKLTLDALTGASPNGAVPQPGAQTFTSPSGAGRPATPVLPRGGDDDDHGGPYVTPGGQIPLDPSFKDKRGAIAFSHERPWGADQRLSLGSNFSAEYDFKSASFSVGLARDFNQKNTTLSLGGAFEYDLINPVGGVPQGMQEAFLTPRTGNSRSRRVSDVLVGVTQVINRHWISQLNLSLGQGNGYQTDPYKLLSVVDGTTGLLRASAPYLAENRPEQRTRRSLYWQHKFHLERDVIDLSYRWYGDSWGVRAHTLDARYRWQFGGSDGAYLEPHLRLHRQGAADFWRPYLIDGVDTGLSHASADPRLGRFSGTTLGAKLGVPTSRNGEFSLRLEGYRQKMADVSGPGYLATVPLTADLKTATLMVGYSFDY